MSEVKKKIEKRSEHWKIIVAGTRDFSDYQLLQKEVDKLLDGRCQTEIEIVSGTARGADKLGEQYAMQRCYSIKRFPADWNMYGNQAGPIRNEQMAKYADACVVFWDGMSSGTRSMIRLAKEYGLELKVVIYK